MITLPERLGSAVGAMVAPFAKWVSHRRHARPFHPDALTFLAEVTPASDDPLSRRFEGFALLRCSRATRRAGQKGPDVLGVGVRLRKTPDTRTGNLPGDQDLLFASLRSLLEIPLALLTTDVRDVLRNTYFTSVPFEVDGARTHFRLVPEPQAERDDTASLEANLLQALTLGKFIFHLEARRDGEGYRRVAHLAAQTMLPDMESLEYSPFHTGLGLVPRGFVSGIRRAVYSASQRGRADADVEKSAAWSLQNATPNPLRKDVP